MDGDIRGYFGYFLFSRGCFSTGLLVYHNVLMTSHILRSTLTATIRFTPILVSNWLIA